MLVNGQEKCKSGITKSPSEDIYALSDERGNQLAYKLVQVEGDGSFISPSEDELMEVEHLLADPKNEKVLGGDDFLYLNPENSEKCLEIEDFSFPDDYCQIKTNVGKLDSDSTQEGKQETKFEFLDDMFQGIDEEGNLHGSDCVNYLLDTEFAEKNSVPDYGQCKVLGSSGLENRSTGLIEKGSGGSEFSNLSSAIIPLSESTSDDNALLLDNMTIPELQEAFRSTFGRETTVKDEQWLKRRILFGLQNLIELDKASCFLESRMGYNENEDDMIFTSNNHYSGTINSGRNIYGSKTLLGGSVRREQNGGGDLMEVGFPEASKIENGLLNIEDRESALVNGKRLRRPTRRYIEESSDVKSRYCSGRLETPTTSSRDKFVIVRSQNQHHRKGFEAVPLVCRQDSLGGSGIQVRRGRPKKNSNAFMGHTSKDDKERRLHLIVPERNSCLEPSQSDSQDDMSDECIATYKTEKGGIRRKHHRLWNLSEVMKLIEGVSRYGVGRWTDIKRLLFSSSVYRTSVDLKDKWRNLLRASGVQFQSKKMVEQRRKHATVLIPQSVLRRVRELAVIYPYPRERKSKLSHAVASPVTIAAVSSSDASISRSGRILHRKNFI